MGNTRSYISWVQDNNNNNDDKNALGNGNHGWEKRVNNSIRNHHYEDEENNESIFFVYGGKRIDKSMYKVKNIGFVRMANHVTEISELAFNRCNFLQEIEFNSDNACTTSDTAFGSNDEDKDDDNGDDHDDE